MPPSRLIHSPSRDFHELVVDVHLEDAVVDVDGQLFGAANGRRAELAGDHGGVAGGATAAGEDALGGDHAVDIVGLGFWADHDDGLACFAPLGGGVGVKYGHTDRGARASIDGLGDQTAAFLARVLLDFGGELRVQQLVHLFGRDTADGLFLGDHAFIGHVHRDLDGGARRALAVAGLQHPQLAALDRELHVLHVLVSGSRAWWQCRTNCA